MRITQSMLTSNMLSSLSASYEKLGQYQDQITTQKKITKPSDDPVVAMKGITYRRNLQEVQQYKRNFSEAYNWLDNSDEALEKADLALQRIRELVVQGSNDTYNQDQRESIGEEINQLKQYLTEIANTKVGDKYIFNGSNTLVKPITGEESEVTVENTSGENDGETTTPADSSVKIELSKGVYINVNITPEEVFTNKEMPMFTQLDNIINALKNPDETDESAPPLNEYTGVIDDLIKLVSNARSKIGAISNRVELMEERVDKQEILAQQMMSENEDIDFEKVITEMLAQESVHRAALSIGARVIQPTLMDFLR